MKKSYLLLLSTILGLCMHIGCNSHGVLKESHELEIAFVSLAEDDPNCGVFMLRNISAETIRIDNVKITNTNSREEIPSSLLKITSQSIPPGSWEYGVFQVVKGKGENQQASSLQIEYELAGNRYFAFCPIKPSCVWIKDVYINHDFSSICLYIPSDKTFSQNEVADANIMINGEKADIADYSILPTHNDHFLICLNIVPPQKLNGGERLCITATWNDKTIYGGCIKAFYAFTAGETQYSKVMRPVDLEYTADSLKLNIYNEADFRKCPAIIERVRLDGEDITDQTILPSKPFPPDLHNYEADERPVIVNNTRINDGKNHRFDFDFKRLEPLRPASVPDGYFDMQSFSCDVKYGVPYEIDQQEGLQGAACTLYAGLRNRPELTEIIRRYNSVVSVDPSIPVYVYPHEGTNPAIVKQLANCNDFIVTGQTIPLIPSTFGKSKKFFDHVQYMRQLSVPWTSSVIIDNDYQPSPRELEWLTWGAIGAGSHGVFLTAHEKGDQNMIKESERGVDRILNDIRSIKSLLGISKPVVLAYLCNQEGIHIDFLACGTDHLLIVVLNEWSTRSAFQESEPFMAAVRKNVEIKLSTKADWEPIVAVDPIHYQAISFTKNEREISLSLPNFDNVQVILLSRQQIRDTLPNVEIKQAAASAEPPVIFLNNPVVSLGTIRPGSSHTIEIPIQSCIDKPIALSGTDISNSDSKPGEVKISDTILAPQTQGNLIIHYTAVDGRRKSVTHVRYSSQEYPDCVLPVYLCAEIEQPADLSPLMIDFGYIPLGTISHSREVKLQSTDASAIISKITADSDLIKEIVIANDKKSFQFAVTSDKIGTFSAQLAIEILINDKTETFTQTVRCTGQFQTAIVASPPQVSVVMDNQPKKYTIGIRHIADKPIKITSVSSTDAIRYNVPPDGYNSEQSIELTILPEILKTKESEMKVTGRVENGEDFTIAIPVSAFSTIQHKPEALQ